MNVGFYSYLSAAAGYGLFVVLLLFSSRGERQGKWLTVVAVTSALWAGLAAVLARSGDGLSFSYQALEVLRYSAWYGFLLGLFEPAAQANTGYRTFIRWALTLCIGLCGLLLASEWWSSYTAPLLSVSGSITLEMTGHLILSILGIAIIEQLFRNLPPASRWSIKYLLIGAAGIFIFDFYLYADALLFRGLDRTLWDVRGIVNLMVVPMLVIAAGRSRQWSLELYVSRDIVLHTTTLIGAGVYLLAVAAGGYYLRKFGGDWGSLVQTAFLTLAIALLAAALFSAQLRTRLRVFLGKHFYRNKYDYRHEWLKLTSGLDEASRAERTPEAVIEVMARIVDARAGLLWQRDGQAGYLNVAGWRTPAIDSRIEAPDGSIASFLSATGYVINLRELDSRAAEYTGLRPPDWLKQVPQVWLVVPLFDPESLLGFIVLANPMVARPINWEDRDLLKAAAQQIASFLTVLETSDALARARQFEAFNRMSAYMVHDLKNVAAELGLVTVNAQKHLDNPEFVQDALDTVDGAARHINKLLEHLRNKRADAEHQGLVDLARVIEEVVTSRQAGSPRPILATTETPCQVVAERSRLASVLTHLIENAQQATPEDGRVEVELRRQGDACLVEIRDTGCGMDTDFIQHRLFKPFDTTKGNAGMGIGMYESREYLQQMGGALEVSSQPGQGTRITLRLPLSTESSPAESVNA